MGTRFFYGTFVVNMTACLIIGFSLTWLGRHTEINPAWRFLIPIGFVGAYSTFSTFEWETFTALQTGAFLMATLYVTLSVLLGLIALWLGDCWRGSRLDQRPGKFCLVLFPIRNHQHRHWASAHQAL